MTFYFSLWHPTDHVLCEDGWDLADLQLVHSIRRSSSPHIHGHAQVGFFTFWFCCRVEEGSKSRQEEGDIKEKLLHSKMDKDLVSRNEKVQVEVNNLLVFQHFKNIFPTWILRLCASVTRMSKWGIWKMLSNCDGWSFSAPMLSLPSSQVEPWQLLFTFFPSVHSRILWNWNSPRRDRLRC